MKLVFSTFVATASATTADWSPCTKQDCTTTGWICCDTTQVNNIGTSDSTGTMICTDPNLKGVVPSDIPTYGGQSYHCTHQAHIEMFALNADDASNLAAGVAAAVLSAYMLA